jgi:hypothetical protein
MARLRAVQADQSAAEEVFARLTHPDEPQTLDEIAKAWRVPRGRFVDWYTTKHAEDYDRALRVLGVSLGHRVMKLTEDAKPEMVGLLKFQTDRFLRLAAHWNAERYSPKVEHDHRGVAPTFNVYLLERPSHGETGGVVVDGTPVPSIGTSLPVVEQANPDSQLI